MGSDRQSLLLRGVLDLCVLSLLEARPVYGYEIVAQLGELGLVVAAGSIYPLVGRLERGGLVTATTQVSASGPPRRWWQLTPAGRAELAEGREAWARTAAAVDAVLATRTQTPPPPEGPNPATPSAATKGHAR